MKKKTKPAYKIINLKPARNNENAWVLSIVTGVAVIHGFTFIKAHDGLKSRLMMPAENGRVRVQMFGQTVRRILQDLEALIVLPLGDQNTEESDARKSRDTTIQQTDLHVRNDQAEGLESGPGDRQDYETDAGDDNPCQQ